MVNIISGIRSVYGIAGNRRMMSLAENAAADASASLARKSKYLKQDTTTSVKVTDEMRDLLGLPRSTEVKPNTPTRKRVFDPIPESVQQVDAMDFFSEHLTGYSRSEIQKALDEILSLKDINGNKLYHIRSTGDSDLFGTHTYSARALLEAKFNDPQRYNDIMQLLKLHQEGKIKYCPSFVMPNGKLNPIIKQDVEALITGKPYFAQFKPDTKIDSNILNKIKEGDVFSVGDLMYVRDKSSYRGYQLLHMDKKTYELLFPPVDRYVMAQGNSENCGIIAMINNLVQVPQNRVKMYQLFNQNKNKITVHALGDVNNTRTFDLNDLKVLDDSRLSRSSIGLKMLEQKGCISNNGTYIGSTTYPKIGIDKNLHIAINSTQLEIPKTDFSERFWEKDPVKLEKYVKDGQAALSTVGNGRTLVTIGGSGYKYGTGGSHCCSVFDCRNGIIKLANPHGTADCLEVPLDVFYGTKNTPYFHRGVFDNA